MANNISGNFNQLGNVRNTGKVKTPSPLNSKSPGKAKATGKAASAEGIFGKSAVVELSPEVEMFGKVVDKLQKKYENAEVFVAGPGDDLSQIGGDLEYSIILSEDEMKLLSSEDPKDKEAHDKLLSQIDDAMDKIGKLSEEIGKNTGDKDDISNFGLQIGKDGKLNFFADINGSSFKDSTMEGLIKSFMASKTE